jgi:Fic family protein
MKFEDYKSGKYTQQYQYQSFSPTPINCQWTWESAEINTLLEDAVRYLGELNAFSKMVPDVDHFIRMHITAEASQSSRIEGTQTNIDEAVMSKEEIDPNRKDDWQEVQNYVQAMNFSIKRLEILPLSSRLIREAHGVLLSGARGQHKLPGEFRKSQNWIGGSSLKDAIFIPPHQDEVLPLMTDLENFWHNENVHVPLIVKIGLSHYQFETIHPFLDGNGRVGRLLITLFLINFKLLDKPCLYLSDFLEKNRSSYFDALMAVRTANNITHWIKFFLNAVIESAKNSKSTFEKILTMKNEVDQIIATLGRRAENARNLIYHLYSYPTVNSDDVCKVLDIKPNVAHPLINVLLERGILKENTGLKKNRLYSFEKYLKLYR